MGSCLENLSRRLGSNMYSQTAANVRDRFAEYFSSPEGKLSYQDREIHRGQLG